jgi:hypothetical protein
VLFAVTLLVLCSHFFVVVCEGKHGGFYNCADRFQPNKLLHHKWENAMTLDKTSWGYSRVSSLQDYMTIEELLLQLISTVRLDVIHLRVVRSLPNPH